MKTVATAGGKTLPAMGLGTWRMGEDASHKKDEIRTIQRAIELGVTLFDTAEIYADGGAERVLGEAIGTQRDQLYLVSKVAPDHSTCAGTIRACEASLKRLGTDVIDLYLLHWIGDIPVEETLQGFARLQEAGKIRAWGVSNFDVADMQALPPGCSANQVLYNPQSRGIEFNLLPWCAAAGIAIMAYTPLGQSGRVLKNPAIKAVATRHGATPGQIALAWGLRHPGVVTIPKTSNPARIAENLGALDIQLTAADLTEIDAAFPPPRRAVALEMI
jgi:diketogulonate reductase-like aldo/keto reductase